MGKKENTKLGLVGTKQLNLFIRFAKDEIKVGKLILDNRLVHFKYDKAFLTRGLNLSPFKFSK
jgi:hypothetical protein